MNKSGQRVVIFSKPSLFARGISRLIEESGLIVVGTELSTDEALTRVQSLLPDIIILANAEPSPSQIITLLDYAPNVRVVCLTLERNLIRVYDRHQLDAHEAQDFVNVLNVPEKPG